MVIVLQSYKHRELPKTGDKVKVYWNLHMDVFSIKGQVVENGKKKWVVVAHGNNLQLGNPSFKVIEKDRLRVLEENRKNVHAFTIGYFIQDKEMEVSDMEGIYYNPRTVSQFMVGDKEANNMNFQTVYMQDKRVFGKN